MSNNIMYRALGSLIDMVSTDHLINGVMAESVLLDAVYGEAYYDSFEGYSAIDCARMDMIGAAITRVKRYSKRLTLEGRGKLFLLLLGIQ